MSDRLTSKMHAPQFWQAMSQREKLLITVACGLLLLLMVALGVVRPLLAARAEAENYRQTAEAEFAELASLAARANTLNAHRNTDANRTRQDGDTSPRVMISQTARAAGITITRIQPSDNGALTLWMDSVASQTFFAWVQMLDVEHGMAPDIVSLQPQGDGSVRAQIQFQGVAGS